MATARLITALCLFLTAPLAWALFGVISSTRAPRIMQFVLRYAF